MIKNILSCLTILVLVLVNPSLNAEDGYQLWLRYELISDQQKLNEYRNLIKGWIVNGNSPTSDIARKELRSALNGLLGVPVPEVKDFDNDAILIAITSSTADVLKSALAGKLKNVGPEGFAIFTTTIRNKKATVIGAHNDIGMLYGIFHFLKL